MKHYNIGGSTANRTLGCVAWRKLSANIPSQHGENPYADRGSLLHNCIEKMINDVALTADVMVGVERFNSIVLDEEMVSEALLPALNAYDQFATDNKFMVEFTEAHIQCDEDMGGTADILAANMDTIFIIDHKFGSKIISPIDNAQGLFYLMCARDDPKWDKLFTPERTRLVIGINQPKPDGGDILLSWETDIARLNTFTEQFYDALDGEDESKPCAGDHCLYCPAMPICPVKTGAARKALMFDPKSIEASELATSMAMVSDIEEWCRTVKKTAHEQAELGMKIAGFKLVAKRASRSWTEEGAVGALAMVRKAKKIKLEDAVDMKLKSVPQFEKLCKKLDVDFSKYDVYYDCVSSGTTLVDEADKRPEVADFAALVTAITQVP